MKLYFAKGACSLAVRIIINELNLLADYEAVDLKTKITETGADFNKINAKGAVPALQISATEVLTENAVIQQYIADQHHATQLLPAVGDLQRYYTLEWLNYVSTELHKGCAPLFNSAIPDNVKDSVFKPLLKKKLCFLNQHLAQHDYLCGKQFMLPDAYLFVVLRWLPGFKIMLSEWNEVDSFFQRVASRPAVKLSLTQEGLL